MSSFKTDNKYYSISMAFVNVSNKAEKNLIKNSFETLFDLIPEAQKGSYYELLGDHFVPIISKGYDINLLKQLKFSKKEAFIGFENSEGTYLDSYVVQVDKRDDSKFDNETLAVFKALGTYEKFSSLHAPIKIGEETIALVCLENFTDDSYSEESRKLLQIFSQQMSNFYMMKHLQEKSERRYQNIISSLIRTIEVKDAYTKGHGERVQQLSLTIGRHMKLKKSCIQTLSNASILHDVGKIGIPTELLNKNGPLTSEEYEIIKEHPFSSKKILDEIEDFEEVAELAYCHHEHHDGSGYPRGLKGSEIPIGAQIIQLADAFDAMTSDRAYRKAFSKEKALNIILDEKGKQFNPDVVDHFLKILE